MILAIRIFQLSIIAVTTVHLIKGRHSSNSEWKYFKISNWVFYLCAICAFVLSFGIAAIIEDQDTTTYAIGVLFTIACIFSAVMMAVHSLWQIKYNDTQLIFRNSFGVSKSYYLIQLHIVDEGRMTHLKYEGKTIAKWDSSIMDTKQEIAFHRAISLK